jgi:uncharacterized protein (TIGR03086 family)
VSDQGNAETLTELPVLFDRALDEFDRRVRAVGREQWNAPTPCTDWDVRTLVNHVVGEQLWAPPILAGQTVDEVGDRFDGDVLGEDPARTCAAASADSRTAAHAPGAMDGTVHVSYGTVPAERYLAEMTLDATVHAWDLARAVGADEQLDETLVGVGLAIVEPNLELLAASGLFGEPVSVPEDSDPQVRLLALLGRRA